MENNFNEQKEYTIKKIEKNNKEIKKWTFAALVVAFTNAFTISSIVTASKNIPTNILVEYGIFFITMMVSVPLLTSMNSFAFRSISTLESENYKVKNDYAFKVLDENGADQKLQKQYAIYKIDKAQSDARRNRSIKDFFVAIGIMNLLLHMSLLTSLDGNSLKLLNNFIHTAAYCLSFTCAQKYNEKAVTADKISEIIKTEYDVSEEEMDLMR